MKKKCILALSLTLCLASLTGCGHKNEETVDTAVPEASIEVSLPEEVPQEPVAEEPIQENVIESTGNPNSDKLSQDAILSLAKKHSGAPYAEVDSVTEDGKLIIHLYDQNEDGVSSTWDWYEIDPETLRGTNFLQEEIYLPEVTAASDPWQAAPLADFNVGDDLTVKFTFTDENVEIVLLSPTGKTYRKESTEPQGKNGDFEWQDDGLSSIYTVRNAEKGLWIAEYRQGKNSKIYVDLIEEEDASSEPN